MSSGCGPWASFLDLVEHISNMPTTLPREIGELSRLPPIHCTGRSGSLPERFVHRVGIEVFKVKFRSAVHVFDVADVELLDGTLDVLADSIVDDLTSSFDDSVNLLRVRCDFALCSSCVGILASFKE